MSTYHLFEIFAMRLPLRLLQNRYKQQLILGKPLHGRYYKILQLQSFALRLRLGPLDEDLEKVIGLFVVLDVLAAGLLFQAVLGVGLEYLVKLQRE